MKPLLIIKTGSTFPQIGHYYGDFEDWITQGLATQRDITVVDLPHHAALPDPVTLAGVIITGSHAMVTEQSPWMIELGEWLRQLIQGSDEVPVLGLCFGHQLLAYTLGGEVGDNPMGMEVGTVPLHLTAAGYQDALLGAIANHPWAQVVHKQSVLTPPPGAVVLASNVHDACQAFRVGERVWGVQFHPEFSADVMRAYLQALRGEALSAQQVEDQLQEVRECEDAAAILRRFAQLTLPRVA